MRTPDHPYDDPAGDDPAPEPPDDLLAATTPPPDDTTPPDPQNLAGFDAVLAALPDDTDTDTAGLGAALVELAAVAAVDDLDDADQPDLDDLDATAIARKLTGTVDRANHALVDQLQLTRQWAILHNHVDPSPTPGAERLVAVGGDGCPTIAEFAIAELGVLLSTSTESAHRLLADTLDLAHRLPRLWAAVLAGDVPVTIARRVADQTRRLPQPAASHLDTTITTIAGKLTWRRLARIVRAATLAADPAAAKTSADQAATEAGIWVDDDTNLDHGYTTLLAKATAGDIAAFNNAITKIATALQILGDDRPLQQRRAAALGILAHPQTALDLLDHANQALTTPTTPGTPTTDNPDNPDNPDQPPAKPCRRAHRRHRLSFHHVLYYHLTHNQIEQMLTGQPGGPARIEDIGPVIADQIHDWLTDTTVTVKPVIDPDQIPAIDRWEIPPTMSEAVGLIKPADYFPWSTTTSRHQDNDHTTPYQPTNQGGPPKQTSITALAKITRRHHRVKTFAGWHVTPLATNTWLWRSPTGHHTLVDPTGTRNLGHL